MDTIPYSVTRQLILSSAYLSDTLYTISLLNKSEENILKKLEKAFQDAEIKGERTNSFTFSDLKAVLQKTVSFSKYISGQHNSFYD